MARFLMPKLSDTMEEGTILRWLRGEGEEVARGEDLVEIETDKATMTVQAPEAGRLAIVAQEGDTLPIGDPIAVIGDDAGAPAAPAPAPPAAAAPDDGPAEDERTEIPVGSDGTAPTIGMELSASEGYPGAEDEEEEPAPAAAPPPPSEPPPAAARDSEREQVRASPLARRRARELGVDLEGVRGTGPGGRIVRADVDAAAQRSAPPPAHPQPAAPAPAPAPEATPEQTPAPDGVRTPLSRLQRTVARRMAASWAQAPHFALERDVDVTEALELRRRLVAAAPEGERPTINDLVVRAVAMAAAERPDLLSRFDGDALVAPSGIHVGVAVAVERGLLVPVVRDADGMRVGRIAAETRRLAARCRDGSITAAELEGSVISVTNLGMLGVDRFTGVINPPEAALLAVGRARPAAVVRDGEIVARDLMALTLSVDHRALYGAEAAALLGRMAELLEAPHALVL